MNTEEQIRIEAFNWLSNQKDITGEVFSRKNLEYGFVFQGQIINLVGASGIWKPRQFKIIPISITSVLNSPYADVISDEGFISYKYRGVDSFHRDNVGLRMAMETKTPLIYFINIAKSQYVAYYPAFIIAENQAHNEFDVAIDDIQYLYNPDQPSQVGESSEYYRRKYVTTLVEHRTHQQSFRIRVLAAYKSQCCLCKLNHSELLDAAHIIPDNELLGDPIVPNGLTLCKIHHSAYDSNIVGISPDYHIHIREDILQEIDGPMLKHGIQELNHRRIILPSRKFDYPDQERLYMRFEKFLKVG